MAYALAEALQLSDNRLQLYRKRAITQIDTWRSVIITLNLISFAYGIDAWDVRSESDRWHREAGDLDAVFTIRWETHPALAGAVWRPLNQ